MTITVTAATLRRIAPAADAWIIDRLGPTLTASFPSAGLASELRAAHFLAQAAHETDGFRTLTEYGGEAYFRRYDGRRDLGNTQAGDGARYRGRGIFQLTGRANYAKFGKLIGVDIERSPSRAADPDISIRTALAYWADRKLSPLADRDDITALTKRINGGTNGLADRKAKLIRAKAALQGRSGAEAVAEVKHASTRAAQAARTAVGGAVAVPSVGAPATASAPAESPAWAVSLAFGLIAGAVAFLVWRAWSQNRDAKVFAADAALGSGEA
jgi:putative chitinase